ncbi:3-5 exonuclease [Pelomyxa schiedti]|nr:3-5 exonuclease [Pelomyxa schiedti]
MQSPTPEEPPTVVVDPSARSTSSSACIVASPAVATETTTASAASASRVRYETTNSSSCSISCACASSTTNSPGGTTTTTTTSTASAATDTAARRRSCASIGGDVASRSTTTGSTASASGSGGVETDDGGEEGEEEEEEEGEREREGEGEGEGEGEAVLPLATIPMGVTVTYHWMVDVRENENGNGDGNGNGNGNGNGDGQVAPRADADAAVVAIIETMQRNSVIGLDLEWSTTSGASTIATIQLCGDCHCLVLGVETLHVLPVSLINLLQSESVIKVGVGIHGDVKRLWGKFQVATHPCVDLQLVAVHCLTESELIGTSLKSLTRSILGVDLLKDRAIRCGNWATEALSQQQITYAATDAWVSRELLFRLFSNYKQPEEDIFHFCLRYAGMAPPKLLNCSKTLKKAHFTLPTPGDSPSASKKQLAFKKVCKLLASTGDFLCYCDEKRLHWYQSRGLAVLVSNEPLTAQLTFSQTARFPENELFFIWTKEAHCAVCGKTEYLSRYNIVPPKYRKQIPKEFKDDHTPNIVLLCSLCHNRAIEGLNKLDRELEKETGLPLSAVSNQKYIEGLRNTQKAAHALKLYSDVMSSEKRNQFHAVVSEFLGKPHDETLTREDLDKTLHQIESQLHEASTAKATLTSFTSREQFEQFCQRWRQNFVDTMNPQHLPSYWNLCSIVPEAKSS